MDIDTKHKLRSLVFDGVKNKKSIDDIRKEILIAEKLSYLSPAAEEYVVHKYCKYCAELLEQEICININKYENDLEIIKKLADDILKVKDFCGFSSELIVKTAYFPLLSDILSHRSHKYQAEIFLSLHLKIGKKLQSKGEAYFGTIKPLSFIPLITPLLDFLSDYKSQFLRNKNWTELLTDTPVLNFEPEWKSFSLMYRWEAAKISSNNAGLLTALRKEKESIPANFNLPEDWSRNVSELLKPLEVTSEISNGKKILQAKMPIFVLSKCLKEIEDKISQYQVEEIHIRADKIAYLDTQIDGNVWQGKNLVVMASTIKCVAADIHWNLSGADGGHNSLSETKKLYPDQNGGTRGNDGAAGQDGVSGHSGGNVTFMASKYENIENLSIHTNGGNGGTGKDGQNGTAGSSGKDGVGFSMEDLQTEFPSPASFSGNYENGIKSIIRAVRQYSASKLEEAIEGFDHDGNKVGILARRKLYLKGTFTTGIQYEFSFSDHVRGKSCYMLLKGQSGELGQQGGFGGIGGQGGLGGYSGNVELRNLIGKKYEGAMPNIFTSAGQKGKDGKNGSDGENGKDGQDGLDVGYADTSMWMKPVYYGPGRFKTYSGENDCAVFCRFYKSYRYLFEYTPEERTAGVRERDHVPQRTATAQKQNAIDIDFILEKAKQVNQGNLTAEKFLTTKRNLWQELITHMKQNGSLSNNRQISKLSSINTCQDANLLLNTPSLTNEQKTNLRKSKSSLKEYDFFRTEYIRTRNNLKRGSLRVHSIHVGPVGGLRALTLSAGKKDVKTTDPFLRHQYTSKLFDLNIIAKLNDYEALLRKCIKSFCEEYTEGDFDEIGRNEVITRARNYGRYAGSENAVVTTELVRDYIQILKNEKKAFNESDINFIAKFYGIHLLWCTELSDAEGFFDEISDKSYVAKLVGWTKGLGTYLFRSKNTGDKIYLSRYKNGFCRLVETDIECWTEDLNCNLLNHLKSYPISWSATPIKNLKTLLRQELSINISKKDFSKWSENYRRVACDICLYFSNNSDRQLRKQAFDMIAILALDHVHCNEIIDIMLKLDLQDWLKEICCLLLKYKLRDENVETFTAKLTTFRGKIQAIPSQQIFHMVFILKTEKVLTNFETALDTIATTSVQISVDEYNQLFKQISPEEIHLQHNKLSILKEIKELQVGTTPKNVELIKSLQYYLYSIYETKPKLAVPLAEACKIFAQNCRKNQQTFEYLVVAMQNFYNGKWKLDEKATEILKKLDKPINFSENISGSVREIEDLHQLIFDDEDATTITKMRKNAIKSAVGRLNKRLEAFQKKMKTPMSSLKVDKSNLADFRKTTAIHLKIVLKNYKEKSKQSKLPSNEMSQTPKRIIKILVQIIFVIKELLGFELRDTQKYAILAAILPSGEDREHLLTQIKTGEGKSCVILAVAIFYGIIGQKTDIVTSSSVLAERDAVEFRQIYDIFGLTVGSITTEDSKERSIQYRKTVIYGEVSQLQRDYLVDHFYNDNIRGAREYQHIIIDEVDSMFLDKGSSVLYLSHSPSDLDGLENIFVFVWNSVIQSLNQKKFDPILMYNDALSSIQKTICKEDLLDPEEDWRTLFECGVIDSYGKCLESNFKKLPDNKVAYLTSVLSLKTEKFNKSGLRCPDFLIPFVRLHLLSWIRSAYHATQLKIGIEYVLHTDHLDYFKGKYPKVMILDLDTGTDLKDSQWSEGLHQFLQLKHGCRLNPLNLKSVFISNISYFQKYRKILGLSGTLGTTLDRLFLQKTYSTNFLVVPTALKNKFSEEEPLLCHSLEEWRNIICSDAREKIYNERSVLILCESIRDAEQIFDLLKERLQITPHLYRRDFEPFEITKNGAELGRKVIIVATNLAGRGTDIKLCKDLKETGGLHVIFSYFPSNSRITSQGFGRAGRCGDPGSGRIIFVSDTNYGALKEKSVSVIDYINQRDSLERNRISAITAHYEEVILKEEKMFTEFKKRFDELDIQLEAAHKNIIDILRANSKDKLANFKLQDVKSIVKQSMLDDWAFWLDEYSTFLCSFSRIDLAAKNSVQNMVDQKTYLKAKFKKTLEVYDSIIAKYKNTNFVAKWWNMFQNRMPVSVEDEAINVVKRPTMKLNLAKYYILQENFEKASTKLDEVLESFQNDHCSLAAFTATYYKIFCRVKGSQLTKNIQADLRSLFRKSEIIKHQQQNIITSVHKSSSRFSKRSVFTEGLRCQKEATSCLISHYVTSVEMLFGKASVEPKDLLDVVNGNNEIADVLFAMLLNTGLIQFPKILDVSEYPELMRDIEKTLFLPYKTLEAKLDQLDYKEMRESVMLKLQKELNFPSMANFWKAIYSALKHSEDMALIYSDPTDRDAAEHFQNPIHTYMNSVRMNNESGLIISTSNLPLSEFKGQVILESQANLNKNPIFLHHHKHNRARVVSIALIDPTSLQNLTFRCYSRITIQDLEDLPGVDSKKAKLIFDFYVKHGILNENGELQSMQLEPISDLKSGIKFPSLISIYKRDIAVMLSKKCCFEYERLRLLDQINYLATQSRPEKSIQELNIFLNNDPFTPFLAEIFSKQLISEGTVNKNVIKTTCLPDDQTFSFLTSEIISTNDIRIIFPSCENPFLEKILDFLKQLAIIDDDLQFVNTFSSDESAQTNALEPQIYTKNTFGTKLTELTKGYKDLVLDVLPVVNTKRFLQKSENRDKLVAALKDFAGLYEDKPNSGRRFNLVKLDFSEATDSGNILEMCQEAVRFELYGLSHVILINENYDMQQNRFYALVVMAIGTAQVAVGLALNYLSYGSLNHFGNAFIQTGIVDILFGATALLSGKFSWRKWAGCKAISTALTVAFLGCSMYSTELLRYGTNLVSSIRTPHIVTVAYNKIIEFGPVIKSLVENEIFYQTMARSFSYLVEKVVFKVCSIILKKQKTSIMENRKLKKVLTELWVKLREETILSKLDEILASSITSYIRNEKVLGLLQWGKDCLKNECFNQLQKIGGIDNLTSLNIDGTNIITTLADKMIDSVHKALNASNELFGVETFIEELIEALNLLSKSVKHENGNAEKNVTKFIPLCNEKIFSKLDNALNSIFEDTVIQPVILEGMSKIFKLAYRSLQNISLQHGTNQTSQATKEQNSKTMELFRVAENELNERHIKSIQNVPKGDSEDFQFD